MQGFAVVNSEMSHSLSAGEFSSESRSLEELRGHFSSAQYILDEVISLIIGLTVPIIGKKEKMYSLSFCLSLPLRVSS